MSLQGIVPWTWSKGFGFFVYIEKNICLNGNNRNDLMKVKYISQTNVSLTNGQIYEVIAIEQTYYRIVDNTGEDYLFPPEEFEIIEK